MMKTNNYTYKTLFAAMFLMAATFSSCEKEVLNVDPEDSTPNTLTLKLFCSENKESRATSSPDNMNNEDAINRLDIFLYKSDANFDTPAVYHKSIVDIEKSETHVVQLKFTNDEINGLFGESGEYCKIYAIANLPSGTSLNSEKTSVNELKAMNIEASFNTFADNDYQPQGNFVMDSDFTIDGNNDKVVINRETKALSGQVPLYRAASKISLVITQVKNVPVTNDEGETLKDKNDVVIEWEAITNMMQVRLHDGVYRGHIDNSVKPYQIVNDDKQSDYYSFDKYVSLVHNSESQTWTHTPAFYSYSSDWTNEGVKDPYLTLVVPWGRTDEKKEDGTFDSYQTTYYQVPISTISKRLDRNTHYKINLVVSRLGSLVPEVPTTISPSSYIIVPWKPETVNADLMDYRYLMVEEKYITIYNENELYIPYVTSHDAEIINVTFAQQDITEANPKWTTIASNNNNYFSNLELKETTEGKQIYFKNILDNVYTSSTFDFTPYKVTFTIRHKNDNNYSENVTIIQYPAIYGEAEQNWDYSNNYNGKTGTDGNNGFTYVNGYQGTDNGNYDFFGSVNGLSGNSNSSPNRYIFTVTSVEGTPYIIGDPRDNSITYNESSANWAVAKALYDNSSNRELKYYYGTDVTSNLYTTRENTTAIYISDEAANASERTINMIAPKFRIASGYAVLNTGGEGMDVLENLKKRCASYQEDGYPAGRWRLPTKAEFEFIVSQVNKGTLPQIYITNTKYWCAHGLGTPNNNGQVTMKYVARDNDGHSVRCVYDEWYWTNKLVTPAEKNVFTWGDQPR